MKTLKCDLCDATAEGETFEEWMTALQPHYREAHADVMSDSSRGKEEMEQWMADNRARFDAASQARPSTELQRPVTVLSLIEEIPEADFKLKNTVVKRRGA